MGHGSADDDRSAGRRPATGRFNAGGRTGLNITFNVLLPNSMPSVQPTVVVLKAANNDTLAYNSNQR